ncbi:hypothetical protein QQP08_014876 [Theobroma cacao]|nr:hypothetical protein QQP08_014876 [Theobroma cacao]
MLPRFTCFFNCPSPLSQLCLSGCFHYFPSFLHFATFTASWDSCLLEGKRPGPVFKPITVLTVNLTVSKLPRRDGNTVAYKFGRNIKLSKLLHSYCQKKQGDNRTVRFVHGGRHVLGQHMADKLLYN